MEMLAPRKNNNSASVLDFPKQKYRFNNKHSNDRSSSHLDTLVKRKMSNKIKTMEKRIKSMINNKSRIQRNKNLMNEVLTSKNPINHEDFQEFNVSPLPEYKVCDLTMSPCLKKAPLEEAPSQGKLLDESNRVKALYPRPNVYDSMEEEDEQVNEKEQMSKRLSCLSYYLTFSAEIAVLLSLLIGYVITMNNKEETTKLVSLALLIDSTVISNIFFSAYLNFRNSSDLKFTVVKYAFTWLIVDLVSCFPVSASILIKTTGLAQVNLILLIVRVVLLRKPNSVFRNLVLTPANLEANRLLKTLILFLATIFYFAVYFRFISEESLSLIDCLYFIVATSISVGYGDITPCNSKERLFAMTVQVVGLIFYTLFISMVSGYISAMTPTKMRLKSERDILFGIYCEFNVPLRLYHTIKEYLTNRTDSSSANMVELLKSLPITVSRELLNKTFKATLEKTPFFAELGSQLASEMLGCLNYVHYEKNEIVLQTGQLCEEVLIVSKGRLKFFSQFHDQPFALARINSGQTFGESQCFLKEQALCSLVSVSSIYKGFIIKASDFDRLTEEYKYEIGILVDNSLTKQECLKARLQLLKHSEKLNVSEEEATEKLDKFNFFLFNLEGEPEMVRENIQIYIDEQKANMNYSFKIRVAKQTKKKKIKRFIKKAKQVQPETKKSTEHSIKSKKNKIEEINENVRSSVLNDSIKLLKSKLSIFRPEERLAEIINISRSQKSMSGKKTSNQGDTISNESNKKSNFNKITSKFQQDVVKSKSKYTSQYELPNTNIKKTIEPNVLQMSVPLTEEPRKGRLLVELDRNKKFQVLKIDGLSIKVNIDREEKEELNVLRKMLQSLKK